jgi:8-oxo-dGTP pyrophosphatase MutT (NUDIX family)
MSIAIASPASTVILLRPASPIDVFLVRRSDSIAFMGGAHVFPGGRVDPGDRLDDVDAMADGADAAIARMTDLPPAEAVAQLVAAARELFEEAGVLLAHPITGAAIPRLATARRALLAGTTSFLDILRAEGLRLALGELVYFAHWVTPEIEIKRFDTRFFVARAPAGQTPVHDAGETIESEWINPAEAIARCRRQDISLPPPTWTTLSMLSAFDSVDAVLAWARAKMIPRVQPRFEKRGEQTLLFYPGDPMYPAIDGFEVSDTRFVLENRRWRPVKPA